MRAMLPAVAIALAIVAPPVHAQVAPQGTTDGGAPDEGIQEFCSGPCAKPPPPPDPPKPRPPRPEKPPVAQPRRPPPPPPEPPPPRLARPEPPQPGEQRPPDVHCFFFVSGLLILDRFVRGLYSEIGRVDPFSNLVGPGAYPDSRAVFGRADHHTFDGIAVGKNTRVTIYRQPKFQGGAIVDQKGPVVINNIRANSDPQRQAFLNAPWGGELGTRFPPGTRRMSGENMHPWGKGTSVKVSCD